MSLTAAIKAEARRLGFARVGIVPAGPSQTHSYYAAWLDQGFAGEMGYLGRHAEAKRDPSQWAEGARSLICLAVNYHPGEVRDAQDGMARDGGPRGRISRYAWGRDYHDMLGDRLDRLAAFIDSRAGRPVGCRAAVDAAPVMEREWAARAGLGWVGRNAMLIDWELGSYVFLAELLVDLELEYDLPGRDPRAGERPQLAARPAHVPEAFHSSADPALPVIDLGLRESCGSCRACVEACPTGAIVADKAVDARRCLSYLTIELKGPIPEEFRDKLGEWVFGCDICQEVCPWNRRAPAAEEAGFEAPDREAVRPSLIQLLALDEEGFRERFRGRAVWRARRRGLLRNAALALGNALARGLPPEAREAGITALARALRDPEPVIRGAAAWALGRVDDSAGLAALRKALAAEQNASVQQEIQSALERREPASASGHP
jgi:epoxyqueuosine reductase